MKKMFLFVAVMASQSALAQVVMDPVLISSKQELKDSEVTSSTLVIEGEEIEKSASGRVTDVLNRAAGVDIVQTGLVGGQASLFLRGMESRHVLILLDGVRVYDPTNADRSFNLAILNSIDIERIEIIKGAQSVLYGSDAISGVVNIITKKGSDKNMVQYSTGYFNQLAVNHTFDTKAGLFNLTAFAQDSEVGSAVADGSEADYSRNNGFTLNHYYTLPRVEFSTVIKHVDNFNYTDANTSLGPEDDKEAYAQDVHTYFKEGITYHHNELVDVNFDVSYTGYNRFNKYLETAPIDYDFVDADGSILTGDLRIKERLDDGHIFYGFNSTQETYETQDVSEKSLNMFDFYALRQHKDGQSIYDYGFRHTANQDYGSHLVYSLGYNYLLSKTQTLKFSHKTGFKAPSIYQQSDPSFGNDDLVPEKSVGLDAEYLYKNPNLEYFFSVYYNDVSDFIQFRNSAFANVSNAKYSGLETGFELKESVGVVGANINLIRYDLSTGKEAARRPEQILKLHYLFNFTDEHSLNIDWTYRGLSYDYNNGDEEELDAYDVWNLDYAFDTDSFKIMGSLKNIFDREYENVFGYATLGLNFQLTVVSRY